MEVTVNNRSPREEGELEDGEICDDEAEESVPVRRQRDGRRPGPNRGTGPRARKVRQLPPLLPPPDFRLRLPYSLPRHGHGPGPGPGPGPFPNGSDRPPSPPRPTLLPPGLVPLGEPSPRSSFWERSHCALGRFRHRAMPNAGRGWKNRGGRGSLSRYSPGDGYGFKTESPTRKPVKPSGRNLQIQVRKVVHKVEESVDESFEDLLSKYRQIQLELECIRKEETMALEPSPGTPKEVAQEKIESITVVRNESKEVPSSAGLEEPSQMEPLEVKVFQAFNIKPLHQKLHQPTSLDPLKPGKDQDDVEKQDEDEQKQPDGEEMVACVCCVEENRPKNLCSVCRESSASSEDSALSPDKAPAPRVEEEELSELQLRLLALQSASKKWQQKELQVLKKSQDRITRAAPDRKPTTTVTSSTPPSVSSNRQRVTTRSTSSAVASPADRIKTRSKSADGDRDLTKVGQRPSDKEREKDRPKPSPKAGQEKGRAVGKAHPVKKAVGSAVPVTKQAVRKQQLRTWKLQQQRDQEEKRRHDEERRHREDEIRRIRDLSNQDEQYNRFMKLVGGTRAKTRSKSRDSDHRKSSGKPGLDTSGNLYQYDNYEEVAMDTDSETGSPVASPTHGSFPPECPGHLRFPEIPLYGSDHLALALPFLPSDISTIAPPPPPLPPPPEALEAPPKPPFADEEEEEEMLLRETCLMSMANKRGGLSEDKTSSGPASPCDPASPSLAVLPPSRGNLSTVSLNTVSQPRVSRYPRGGHNNRVPLVLPRHKSVVISLNDSDDSDSDMDACGTTESMFKGLEFMIKEARRTVEAAKPKAAMGSEKENNPLRPSDLQQEVKKADFHQLLRVEPNREKQKTTTTLTRDLAMWSSGPSVQSSTSSVTQGTAVEPSKRITMEMKLWEAEQKLQKNRELLQKDEAVLQHLLQQELKKRESLKSAEAKMSKLREQLQASEKIVNANRTLLKKLQEQVQRVEHRVSVKKTLASKLEEDVSQAQLLAGSGIKRRTDAIQTMVKKRQRVDGIHSSTGIDPKHHYKELMMQKQRLQQLESEYALKIQRLKEAQALLQSEPPRDLPPSDPETQVPPPSPSFPVPQPSLHDLTQDKLTLDSEDTAEVEDTETEPATTNRGPRRLSLHQSSSFTKPNLEGSLPVKEASKPTKMSPTSLMPAETFAGLDLDTLKLRYKQKATLSQILQEELQRLEENKQDLPDCQVKTESLELDLTTKQSGNADLRPVPFARYQSPLLVFRSYRFSPYYRTKEKLSLSSVTYSNVIQPMKCFCRFDLTGTCNDDDCGWQHMRNCALTGDQLFQNLLSYDLSLIGCSEKSSEEDVCTATETYMKKLFGTNKDRMGVDQKAVLLVSKVNESKRHVPPHTTCKEACRWRPKLGGQGPVSCEAEVEQETSSERVKPEDHGMNAVSTTSPDVCVVTSEDKRYFISETDDISNLESSVLENPGDTQLWIKLAFKYLENSLGDSLEAALNTLSRALENNCDDPEIWTHYLLLFSRRGSREEVQEMCEMAVEHAPDQRVWWNYLTLETTFEGKDYVCERLLQFLITEASSGVTDELSFHLMEALFYRVELSLFTGRRESALLHFQNSLKSPDHCLTDHLTTRDLALVWLSYIHLTEFDRMPSSLFDPAESGPSRLVNTEIFLLPWTSQNLQNCPDSLIALFQDAISQCSSRSPSAKERIQASLPLYLNLVHLNKLLNKYDEGISLCESLLQLCPDSRPLLGALVDLHLRRGDKDKAVAMWLQAVSRCPGDPEVFYGCCRFLVTQEKGESVASLFREFVLGECEDELSQESPVDVLRHILGFPTEQLMQGPVKKGALEHLLQQRAYLHLVHCQWQWLHGSVDTAVDAFERALGSDLTLDQLYTLWMDYLSFSCSHLTRSSARGRFKAFSDLVQRCLITAPTRLEVPFNPGQFWNCYSFHNKVITFYLRLLPQSQHALLLERLRPAMNNNVELNLRSLNRELQEGNLQQVKFSCRALINNVPRNLSAWKLAIAVEVELHRTSEVRPLYQQALKLLPLCAELWTHHLLFEAADCAPTERLKRLVDQCEHAGVSLVGGAQRDDG